MHLPPVSHRGIATVEASPREHTVGSSNLVGGAETSSLQAHFRPVFIGESPGKRILIARRANCWKHLLGLHADVALLQEAAEPPPEIAESIEADPAPWRLAGRDCHGPRAWRAAVVKLADRVQVEWIEAKSIDAAEIGELSRQPPGHTRGRARDRAGQASLSSASPCTRPGRRHTLPQKAAISSRMPRRTGSCPICPHSSGAAAVIASSPPAISTFCTAMESMAMPTGPDATR